MHPAKSVIFFTTTTGLGYGLMIWLALLGFAGLLPADSIFGLVAFGIAFAAIIAGLLSSTFHLGRPERAWRALSQWRSSWLSREGVSAILTFIPLGLYALFWIFGRDNGGMAGIIGLIGAAMSLITVYTTSMIYASLKPIPAWHNGWTVAGYLTLCIMNGAVALILLACLFGYQEAVSAMSIPTMITIVIGLAVKLAYWHHIRSAPPGSTIGSATGLGHLGDIELSASPHDQDNYLLREMGFRIARKHASKLRIIAIMLAFVVPFAAVLGATAVAEGGVKCALLFLALLSCQIGLLFERWLFFAEAKHVVTLYYGEQAV